MPLVFGLGYQDLPNLSERIRIMRDVLLFHSQRQARELAEDGTISDGEILVGEHAEETIRQVHRELTVRDLGSEKNTKGRVDVFEMLKTWRYLETEHAGKSISIRTAVNDLDVVLMLLNTDPSNHNVEGAERGMPAPKDFRAAASENMAESRPQRGRPRQTPNLHPEVETFLDKVSRKAERRITIAEFCLASGFADDTVFGFWRQGNTERCLEVQAKRFERTLNLSPQEFLAKLAQVKRNRP